MAIVLTAVEELQQLRPFSISYSIFDKDQLRKVMQIVTTSTLSGELCPLETLPFPSCKSQHENDGIDR